MKMFLSLLFVFCVASPVWAQLNVTVKVGTPVNYLWDYTVADAANSQATHFLVTVGANKPLNPGLIPGATLYTWPVPSTLMTLGKHVVSVQACNAAECGPASAQGTLTVTGITPPAPTNPRFQVPPGPVINIEHALALVHGYGWWVIDRPLTVDEIQFLVSIHEGELTKLNIGVTLDKAYVALSKPPAQ